MMRRKSWMTLSVMTPQPQSLLMMIALEERRKVQKRKRKNQKKKKMKKWKKLKNLVMFMLYEYCPSRINTFFSVNF